MLENEIQGNPSSPTDIYSSHHISIFYTSTRPAIPPQGAPLYTEWLKCKVNTVCSTCYCVSTLNVLMYILIHKYCIGCSVFWCRSCFQLFAIEPALLVLLSGPLEQRNVTDDMSLLYAGLNTIPSPCQGRDFGQSIEWSPGLLPMIHVLHLSLIT